MKNKIKKTYEYIIVKLSKEFDESYYLQNYPDVEKAKISPLKHFCNYGWRERKNPSKEFDVSFYLSSYPDIEKAKINPLLHYIKHGKKEGRRINDKGVVLKHCSIFEKTLYLLKDAKEKPYLISKLIYELRQNGFKRTIAKTKFFLRKNLTVSEVILDNEQGSSKSKVQVIPYYIDPVRGSNIADAEENLSLAIHIHIKSLDSFQKLLKSLKPIKNLNLYLSVSENIETKKIKEMVDFEITGVNKLVIEMVPSYIDVMAAMVVTFSKELLLHEYIAHFHTDIDENVSLLIEESGVQSGEILTLLQKDVKVVFAQSKEETIKNSFDWNKNREFAKTFLEKYTSIDIDDYSEIEFPENGMFWAKSASLEEFLKLPLSYEDFEKESYLEGLLRQILLVFSSSYDGENYCIYRGDTLKDYCYYEEQQDFSNSIVHKDVKVLSYYLGQFHPIPENDEWHGTGFTEWTNVKSAYPLYEGHYQQHIPLDDIGYYMLDNPEILKKQADMMKKSGVYGQIFYHYWFTGKLILEKPVQMLFDNKDIDMPFCFCWANENWTKRWDGNDAEILLGQEYSAEDARAFIKYLIPFFQDSRYIKVDGRPMLYVYRPSSIEDTKEYIDIWKEECEKVSLKAPYVVAVLTRGAIHPSDHHMDAGVERILHDWTGGEVPELKNSLKQYHYMSGSVLSYSSVASFYEDQSDEKDFTYFRSISPMWDNAARYKEGAYILDKATPNRFQIWFKNLLRYTEKTLEPKEQFLIVNAWNEWAEGAHLEPDTYHGYAYLNSIGRALSDMSDDSTINTTVDIPQSTMIYMTMSDLLKKELESDLILKKQFLNSLKKSSIFKKGFEISSDIEFLVDDASSVKNKNSKEFDLKIELHKSVIFDTLVLEKMVHFAFRHVNSKIISNTYSDKVYQVTENGSVDATMLYDTPIIVTKKNKNKNVKICTDAKCFLAPMSKKCQQDCPEVSTIIRFHKSASLVELKNALFCLASMKDVVVIPLITAQDLDADLKKQLNNMIEEIPFKDTQKVQVSYFTTPDGSGDMRTIMLNEALKNIKTNFATFLDYDDLLFSDAYSYLVSRIKETGKSVSFGRVYEASYDGKRGLIIKRERKYEYGFSYEDFLGHNHAPLHSFMIDTTKFDFSDIVYYDDQKYMEDYLLTLQLFTKDKADWEGLKDNVYIGDYIHSIDRDHTLAFSNDSDRRLLLEDIEYKRDDKRVSDMRSKVL